MNWMKAGIAAGAVVVLAGGALAMRGEASDGRGTALRTVPVEHADLVVRAEAAGQVEPIRAIEVKSKASGEVLRVFVETGDFVERGTILAEIDPRDVQNALAQAVADLESARVRFSTAEAHRGRVEALRRTEVVTQQEYEAAVDAAASARAALVRAETNAQLARERSRDVSIVAPTSGTIIVRSVEPGQVIASATSNVSGGTALFTMADLSEIQVRARVDETDIGRVSPGQEARVTVEAYPGRTFQGTVLKVEPQAVVEQNVTMFPVLVRLSNPDGALKPGMNAEVSMETARSDGALAVPTSAVASTRDAGSAAAALGLDPEALRSALSARPEGAAPRPQGAGARPEGAGARPQRTAGAGRPEGAREDGGPRGARGERGARGGPASAEIGASVRPGVVFVQTPAGPEPRRVMLGVSDWERVEILRGVELGEEVYLISAAQIQQSQRDAADRIRERSGGGVFPGGGGSSGRRGG